MNWQSKPSKHFAAQPTPARSATARCLSSRLSRPSASAPASRTPQPFNNDSALEIKMDKADLVWVTVSTLLVLLMVVPGLALFYGGLVRAKNVLSVLLQVLSTFALAVVLWFFYGYSLAFTEGNAVFGGFDRLLFSGMYDLGQGTFALAGTIPELSFAAFQATLAGITCALVVGGFAERTRYSAVLVFTLIWMTLAYIPIAHMVWAPGGWLFERGALDFAGGTVVHINAGIAGLVGAWVVGSRLGHGRESMQPHNLPLA